MLKIITKFLDGNSGKAELSEEAIQKRIQIASCVILLETALIDDEFSGIEKTVVEAILRSEFDLSETDAAELIDLAARKRDESVDLWEFTDILNKNYSDEQRIQVLESAWRVIYADDRLNRHEITLSISWRSCFGWSMWISSRPN